MTRQSDLETFYSLLSQLAITTQGTRLLSHCNGRMQWPHQGIYFFFEPGEYRSNGKMRVVRVGTHALKLGSKTTLWNRLSQHQGFIKGSLAGGGNHRGSVFRKHVGTAIITKNQMNAPTWAVGSSAEREIQQQEHYIECLVSDYIRKMPFLWVKVEDKPSPESDRGILEKNSIALLSNYHKENTIDSSSHHWLGHYTTNEKIKMSGLWNVNHVDETYDPVFLYLFEQYVGDME